MSAATTRQIKGLMCLIPAVLVAVGSSLPSNVQAASVPSRLRLSLSKVYIRIDADQNIAVAHNGCSTCQRFPMKGSFDQDGAGQPLMPEQAYSEDTEIMKEVY